MLPFHLCFCDPPTIMRDLIDAPCLTDLADSEGSVFTVRSAEDAELVLDDVDTTYNTRDDWEQFTLLFRGPLNERVKSGVHRVDHPHLDTFDLDLRPVQTLDPNPKAIRYQATFTRHVPDREPERPYRGSTSSRRGFFGKLAAALGGAGFLGGLLGTTRTRASTRGESPRRGMADPTESMIGSIALWPVTNSEFLPPNNWLLCDGKELPIDPYSALFNLIGTTYGGDGRSTFRIPDLRQRVPVGSNLMGRRSADVSFPIGEPGGQANVNLSVDQMPAHTHSPSLPVSTDEGTATEPDGNALAAQPSSRGTVPVYTDAGTPGGSMTVKSDAAGSGQAHENMPPYLPINFIIAVNGTYPSRV
jgi:microcystin-dependent protein